MNDLDNPATLKRLPVSESFNFPVKDNVQGLRCELPTTKAFRRYIAQQGGLLDECEYNRIMFANCGAHSENSHHLILVFSDNYSWTSCFG